MKDGRGYRMVAGCFCIKPCEIPGADSEILLLSSRRRPGQWVLPKGGIEKCENGAHAALRETWEEGGVKGKILEELGQLDDTDGGKRPTNFQFYVMLVEQIATEWPEKEERERLWCTADEALSRCNKPIMKRAIQMFLSKSAFKKAPAVNSS